MPIADDDAKLEDYYGELNYEHEEDIDPPDINEPVEYDEPDPYGSDTEDSEEEDDASAITENDGAFIEPEF